MAHKAHIPTREVTFSKAERAKMGLAHFTYDEVHSMTVMQGEEIVDKMTNIPAFPKLSAVFRNPEIRAMFKEVTDLSKRAGGLPPEVKALCDKIRREEPAFKELTPSTALGKYEKSIGTQGDTQIAMVPFDVLAFLDSLRGKPKLNSKDGLPMYFWGALAGGAAMLLGGFMAHSADEDRYEHQERERERERQFYQERYERQKAEKAADRQTAGWNNKYDPSIYVDTSPTPIPENFIHQVGERETKKTGGLVGKPIKGRGNGQSDDIKVDSTKEGEWIWDASTVADLGDGATDAGWKEIRRLEEKIKKMPGFMEMHVFKPGVDPRPVKTALSNGEYRTPTKIVTAIGRGDNAKGADILRAMTEDIRRHKNSNGDKLPPPITDPFAFFEKAVSSKLGAHDNA